MLTFKELNAKKQTLQKEIKHLQELKKDIEKSLLEFKKFKECCNKEMEYRLERNKKNQSKFGWYGGWWSFFGETNFYKNDEERIQAIKNKLRHTTYPEVYSALADLLHIYYSIKKSN